MALFQLRLLVFAPVLDAYPLFGIISLTNMKWVKWIEFFVAFWVFVSPWILGFSEIIPALWSCIISGVILMVIVSWELFGDSASS